MRISLVNYFDAYSGSGRAVRRLFEGFSRLGQDTSLLVCREDYPGPRVHNLATGWRGPWLWLTQRAAAMATRLQRSGNPMPRSLNVYSALMERKILAFDPEVINLHWVNGEMLTIAEIARLAARRPLVWTFHDAWPICGAEHHCHIDGNARWREGYYSENRDKTDSGFDIDRWTWRRKKRFWPGRGINVIAPSRWLAEMAKASPLFRDALIRVVPNGLDLAVFRLTDQAEVRTKLHLPLHKRLIGFGSAALNNANKGGGELVVALSRLMIVRSDVELVTVGSGAVSPAMPLPVHNLGEIKSESALADFYNALDAFVLPSRQDNLPNMIMEAMACGVSCVAYDIGGMSDMITHQRDGYLARPFDIHDFVNGIATTLDASGRAERRENARAKVERSFSLERVCGEYLAFYDEAKDRYLRGRRDSAPGRGDAL